MNKVNVAGLKINSIDKIELLAEIRQRILNGQKTFLTTPYSEFLYRSLCDNSILDFLNQADFAVPDGIGLFWAKRFLELPLTNKNYFLIILQSYWQAKWTLASIIFYPSWVKSAFVEKIPGSDFVWDLSKLAAENNWSIYFLGGFGDTPKLASEKLLSPLFDGRQKVGIAGYSNKNPDDPSVLEDIKKAKPDVLFVAYGPINQERFIASNWPNLPVKLAVGLGGTFDYLARKRQAPPKFMRQAGLEWLWRLATQPQRIKRIYQATFGLVGKLVHYKVFATYGLRPNAVSIIFNQENKIFIGRKLGSRVDIIKNKNPEKWKNYWQFPQGGIEPGENVIAGAQRETEEETGMRGLKFIYKSTSTYTYFWNNALRNFWVNRDYLFAGQIQQVLYFKFSGDPNAIKLPAGEEFSEYQWATAAELPNIVASERLPIVKIVTEDLKVMAEKAII